MHYKTNASNLHLDFNPNEKLAIKLPNMQHNTYQWTVYCKKNLKPAPVSFFNNKNIKK